MLYFISLVNLIICAQSLFLFFHFLLKKKGELFLNKIIAALSLLFSLIVANTYLGLNELNNSIVQDLANNVMWFIGPGIYFFVTYHQKPPTKQNLLIHSLPYLCIAAINIFHLSAAFDNIVPMIGFTQMSIYLFHSIKVCINHYRAFSSYYNWILPTVITFTVLILINFSLRILSSFDINLLSSTLLQSFTTLLSIPIFFIAYKEMNDTDSFGIQKKKYSTTPLSDQKLEEYQKAITESMEVTKLYLDPNLTLQQFAKRLNIPSKYVSQTINHILNMSFSEFLLGYRLEEVKKNLVDPNKQNLTINGIAEESGFSSPSRFNHLFKQKTGLTPSQYQKEHRA